MEKPVFNLDTISPHYTRAVGNYQQTTAARQVHCMHVAEEATWTIDPNWTDWMSHINCQGHRNIPMNYLWWTNKMNRVPRLQTKEEYIRASECEKGNKSCVMRPWQKSISMSKDIRPISQERENL